MDTANLHKPRVLCLHGGGVSAEIFTIQCRSFVSRLKPHFRLVFADGPFLSEMHEALKPYYEGFGPCRMWYPWKPEHAPVDGETIVQEIEYSLKTAMAADSGDGEWVGLLGFSQGARMAASILFDTQLRQEQEQKASPDGMYGGFSDDVPVGFAGGRWRFAVCMNGRGPPLSLGPISHDLENFMRAGNMQELRDPYGPPKNGPRLRLPSLHVLGLEDPDLVLHRKLRDDYCEVRKTVTVEWDGDHRVAYKPDDTNRIIEQILRMARSSGALRP